MILKKLSSRLSVILGPSPWPFCRRRRGRGRGRVRGRGCGRGRGHRPCCQCSPSVLPCAAAVFICHASSVGLWSVRHSPAMSGGDFPHRRDESFFQSAL